MIKKLASRVREYKKQTIATPLFMVGEVAMEALIPTIISWLIDRGINAEGGGSLPNILLYGGILILAATVSLISGRKRRPWRVPALGLIIRCRTFNSLFIIHYSVVAVTGSAIIHTADKWIIGDSGG